MKILNIFISSILGKTILTAGTTTTTTACTATLTSSHQKTTKTPAGLHSIHQNQSMSSTLNHNGNVLHQTKTHSSSPNIPQMPSRDHSSSPNIPQMPSPTISMTALLSISSISSSISNSTTSTLQTSILYYTGYLPYYGTISSSNQLLSIASTTTMTSNAKASSTASIQEYLPANVGPVVPYSSNDAVPDQDQAIMRLIIFLPFWLL